jgi:hypothetical protein
MTNPRKRNNQPFHTIDPFFEDFLGNLYQSSIDNPFKYFYLITLPHNEELWLSHHKLLAAKD